MKKMLVLLFVFLAFNVVAQSPYQYLKYEDNDVIFERVYEVSGTATEIETTLKERLPGVKNLMQFNAGAEQMTGQLQNCYVQYKKYGGTDMGTLMLLHHPMSAAVSAFWKDGKYRIVVSRMQWVYDVTLLGTSSSSSIFATDTFYSKRGWKQGKIVFNGGKYTEKYLSDLFDVSKEVVKKDW